MTAGAGSEALAQGPIPLGSELPFSFELVKERASGLARTPWQETPSPYADILERIDYDAYQKIKIRPESTLWQGGSGPYPVQLFHLGRLFKLPVRVHLVSGDRSRELIYSASGFESPADHPARSLPDGIGFAGFRLMARDMKTDWLSFLGASYFRTSGPFDQYGLSARALAIDTALPKPEEFPRFTEFWLVPADTGGVSVVALLDSPSVTGAYRITSRRTTNERGVHRIVMDIDAQLFARKDIERLGIAPFSSMYWFGENSRLQGVDWRPEIHDSDGLAIWTGSGERIWRPINNPPRVMTSAFVDKNVKGFGLLQRDRNFNHYQDDGVFYERRASVWVEPLGEWGDGAVHLVEIPTDDEVHDNIVAYWEPADKLKAGQTRTFSYKLSWLDDIDMPANLGRTKATRLGIGGRPGQKRPAGVRKFAIDFDGAAFDGLTRADGVELVVTASRGEISNDYSHPVVSQKSVWRAFFDLKTQGDAPVDLRAYLRHKGRALTETWIYQYFPNQG
jgi:glucans biosynthesis protein